MGLTPLTPDQKEVIDGLVAQRRLEPTFPDHAKAATFFSRAQEAVADVVKLDHSHTAYSLAYDACHDVGEALLAAYGYRTRSGSGQHDALGKFLVAVLDAPEGMRAAQRFDQLRRARNKSRYDAAPIGRAEVDLATKTAKSLIAAAQAKGVAASLA